MVIAPTISYSANTFARTVMQSRRCFLSVARRTGAVRQTMPGRAGEASGDKANDGLPQRICRHPPMNSSACVLGFRSCQIFHALTA